MSNGPLARVMDGHIMRCGTIGSCQSVATSEIVKRCYGHESDSCKWCYNKCPDLYLYFYVLALPVDRVFCRTDVDFDSVLTKI